MSALILFCVIYLTCDITFRGLVLSDAFHASPSLTRLQTYSRGFALTMSNYPAFVVASDETATTFVTKVSKILRRQIVSEESIKIYDADSINSLNTESFNKLSESEIKECKFIYLASEDNFEVDQLHHDVTYAICIPKTIKSNSIEETKLCQNVANLVSQLNSGYKPREDILLNAGEWSHFLSLTYSRIDDALHVLPELTVGIDALELRVDLLEDQSSGSIHRQISLLRSVSDLPIVYTVRSIGQIGKFPEDPKAIFRLLKAGLRAGVEWLDVEACSPRKYIEDICKLAVTEYSTTASILGSLHVTTPQATNEIAILFEKADLFGYADMLKVVTGAHTDADCHAIHTMGSKLKKPYIGVCLGPQGSLSRVLNKRFTPVTHPLMTAAAPGQLSVAELMQKRLELKLVTPKIFSLFGNPIRHSLSPAMHNSAFQTLALPYVYTLNEQSEVASYSPLLHSKNMSLFAGASVTIPHKEAIMELIDEIRSPADIIGAVNTIAVEESTGKLIGYNTDWLGVLNPMKRQLTTLWGSKSWAEVESGRKNIGLVIGAGGTAKAACYALNQLGLHVVVANRDEDKGRELAERFSGRFIPLSNLADLIATLVTYTAVSSSVVAVVSTVPPAAQFTLPISLIEHLRAQPRPPVIMDVVYRPARTPLLNQAEQLGYPLIQGASMLAEQGAQQFEIWHKRRAPITRMRSVVFRDIENLEENSSIKF